MNPFSDAARWFSATGCLTGAAETRGGAAGSEAAWSRAFAAMLEPLEDRTVLNVTVTGAATNTITFTSTSASDNLYIFRRRVGFWSTTPTARTTTPRPISTFLANQKIIVSESGGTLNLQNLDTQGGNLEIRSIM